MEKVYISGAIEHLDLEERKEEFQKVQWKLEDMGYFVINTFN